MEQDKSNLATTQTPRQRPIVQGQLEPSLPRVSWSIRLILLALISLLIWAAVFRLDEVSTGNGQVIASSKEQVIQSLEGGILAKLLVREGNIVQKGQVLAHLDPERAESTLGESRARLLAAQATATRLNAEVNQTPLSFAVDLQPYSELVRSETELYHSRRDSLEQSLSRLNEAMALVTKELHLTEPLVAKGAASNVEVLRLQRQLNELETKATDLKTQYFVKAREELAKANAEVQEQLSVTRGHQEQLKHLVLTAPMRGVVKDIVVNTVGGVIAPSGRLMTIVPLNDRLEIETKILPRDIAYIHPGQKANVKISAYDYSIYGGLSGVVTTISPDTIQDEVRRDQYYYRVYLRTDTDSLKSQTGQPLPIVPGMMATVDIHTGSKPLLQYLLKPLNKAGEALRER
ncbi:HlyD family type I secretion periplasmic adaptor subunit [Neisseriaceae bacterium TC5R-5]|nr:HlyD family type I secretion periplasmic adaptor subunit [Neisseriaceae bacterium TC5R-5]